MWYQSHRGFLSLIRASFLKFSGSDLHQRVCHLVQVRSNTPTCLPTRPRVCQHALVFDQHAFSNTPSPNGGKSQVKFIFAYDLKSGFLREIQILVKVEKFRSVFAQFRHDFGAKFRRLSKFSHHHRIKSLRGIHIFT